MAVTPTQKMPEEVVLKPRKPKRGDEVPKKEMGPTSEIKEQQEDAGILVQIGRRILNGVIELAQSGKEGKTLNDYLKLAKQERGAIPKKDDELTISLLAAAQVNELCNGKNGLEECARYNEAGLLAWPDPKRPRKIETVA